MVPSTEEVSSALTRIAEDAEASFGELTVAQLNWKPAPNKWSVAQCLDHLIVIQSQYFPALDALAESSYSPTFWERYSPLSGLFGRMLIRALDPANARKTKTAPKSEPSSSELGLDIVPRFVEHQAELVARIQRLPAALEPSRVVISSPLSRLVTYSLDDGLTILVVHGRRHLGQARRVTTTPGFPAAG